MYAFGRSFSPTHTLVCVLGSGRASAKTGSIVFTILLRTVPGYQVMFNDEGDKTVRDGMIPPTTRTVQLTVHQTVSYIRGSTLTVDNSWIRHQPHKAEKEHPHPFPREQGRPRCPKNSHHSHSSRSCRPTAVAFTPFTIQRSKCHYCA